MRGNALLHKLAMVTNDRYLRLRMHWLGCLERVDSREFRVIGFAELLVPKYVQVEFLEGHCRPWNCVASRRGGSWWPSW